MPQRLSQQQRPQDSNLDLGVLFHSHLLCADNLHIPDKVCLWEVSKQPSSVRLFWVMLTESCAHPDLGMVG